MKIKYNTKGLEPGDLIVLSYKGGAYEKSWDGTPVEVLELESKFDVYVKPVHGRPDGHHAIKFYWDFDKSRRCGYIKIKRHKR